MTQSTMAPPLCPPELTDRFRPTRAGVIQLWDYADEEFVFAGGWLALRGPNGSGKTKALEVLFPFVFDGSLDARRLNPFSDTARTMASNILFAGRQSAISYAWMELCRLDGEAFETVTIGVGMRASATTADPKRWYLVIDGRVGVDFSLLGPGDVPLSKDQLEAQVGRERVCEGLGEYRRRVDRRLFGLGADRYDRMIALMLTLRRPMLANSLDPGKLSDTLTEGLRPLDPELLEKAARSFEDLQAVKDKLDGLRQADDAAKTFLRDYLSYLRGLTRHTLDQVDRRLDAVAAIHGDLGRDTAALRTAETKLAAALARAEEIERDRGAVRGERKGLADSEAYRAGSAQLQEAREALNARAKAVEALQRSVTGRQSALHRSEADLTGATQELATAQDAAGRLAEQLAEHAGTSGVSWAASDVDEAVEATARARATIRDTELSAVRSALAGVANIVAKVDAAKDGHDGATLREQEAVTRDQAAAEATEAHRSTLRQAVAGWASTHTTLLDQVGAQGILGPLADAVEEIGDADGNTLAAAVDDALHAPRARLSEARALADQRQRELERKIEEMAATRARIAAERDDAPPLPLHAAASRDGRPGAALWQLARFRDGVADGDAAALEAALEAAVLLTGWMSAAEEETGDAVRAGLRDVCLLPLPTTDRPTGSTLADILVPEDTDLVPRDAIAAVLASVAFQPDEDFPHPAVAAVGADGRYAAGLLTGRAGKAAPEFIGATARAARRAARLRDLDEQMESLRSERRQAIDERDARAELLGALRAAVAALPDSRPLRRALSEAGAAAAALASARQGTREAATRYEQATAQLAVARTALREAAARARVEPADDTLRTVKNALARFQADATSLARDLRRLPELQRRKDDLTGRVTEDRGALDKAADQLAAAERDWEEADRRFTTLTESVGAEVAQTERRIAELSRRLEDLNRAHKEKTDEAQDHRDDSVRARADLDGHVTALATAAEEAQRAAHALAGFAGPEVALTLGIELPAWPPPALPWPSPQSFADTARAEAEADNVSETEGAPPLPEAVRQILDRLTAATTGLTPTEESVKAATTRMSGAFQTLMGALAAADADLRPALAPGPPDLVQVSTADGALPFATFAKQIADERAEREILLTEQERAVLEDALLTQLARQIHDRTIEARDLVGEMNTQMRQRRMSSGSSVGIAWEISDALDPAQRQILDLLRQRADMLGPEELIRIREHFARRILARRDEQPSASYRDVLSTVLDYRQWRTFVCRLVLPDGTEERLTKTRHSTLSVGEKAVSLHLPLFAAAHAMFSSGDPHAPRLIALDEAFNGVDDNGVFELISLAVAFDFDLFCTGWRLWLDHPQVAAVAHYDLAHSTVEHTVSTVLVLWDGQDRWPDDLTGSLATQLGSPCSRRVPVADGGGDGLLPAEEAP